LAPIILFALPIIMLTKNVQMRDHVDNVACEFCYLNNYETCSLHSVLWDKTTYKCDCM